MENNSELNSFHLSILITENVVILPYRYIFYRTYVKIVTKISLNKKLDEIYFNK